MMCERWLGTKSCGSTDGTRQYMNVVACRLHSPAVLAGRLDVNPDPEWGAAAGYALSGWKGHTTGETKIDERHRKSGQRASGALRRASHAG